MGSRTGLLLFLMALTAESRSPAAGQQLYRIGVGLGDITGPAAEIIMVRKRMDINRHAGRSRKRIMEANPKDLDPESIVSIYSHTHTLVTLTADRYELRSTAVPCRESDWDPGSSPEAQLFFSF